MAQTLMPQDGAGSGLPVEAAGDSELYRSLRTVVCRRFVPGVGRVVLKQALGPDALARCRHESRILSRLAGVDGVVRLLPPAADLPVATLMLRDSGSTTLAEALSRKRLISAAQLPLALRLARTVAAMHECGVFHADINPANILLCGDGHEVELIDFHLASSFAENQAGFTHHREIAGTLAYLAPEQSGRTGRSVDQRADLYALGATLYELTTGQPPFLGDDPLQLVHDHLVRRPVPPIERNAEVPRLLSDIILRLLEKEPDRRYQSAHGLAHDLARLQSNPASHFALGEHDHAWRLVPPSQLVGRQAEIGALRLALKGSLQQRRRGVLVRGAPGVGKTSLINELRPQVTELGGWFVSGKFDQYQAHAASATVQALRALGRLLLAEPEDALALQRQRLVEALGNEAGVISALLPEFALLLAPQGDAPELAPSEAEQRWRRLVLGLLRAVVSPERPLVLVLDDLQWAGAASLRFVEDLLADDSLRGLLFVGAYREAEVDAAHPLAALVPRWAGLDAAPLVLHLQNLPPSDLGELLGQMLRLPRDRAAALADAVALHTSGNPYDSVELINALRREGVLVPGAQGWTWDEATVRQHVGQANVIELLQARIARLPAPAQALLDAIMCLGGDLPLGRLQMATGLAADELERCLAAPLEDGLLVLDAHDDGRLTFRHDRVQQALREGMPTAERNALHLALARRLAAAGGLQETAAEQYLPAVGLLDDAAEARSAAGLLRAAAARARLVSNHAAVERFLGAAVHLMTTGAAAGDSAAVAALEIEHHSALYSLGRLDEADAVYARLEGRGLEVLARAAAVCVQVVSLTSRGRAVEALALGLATLRQLGLDVPAEDDADALRQRLEAFFDAMARTAERDDFGRPLSRDAHVAAAARLINRLISPAGYCSHVYMTWLVTEAYRLWVVHGPSAELAPAVSHAALVTVATRQDYRSGYEVVRHALAVSEARGFDAAAPMVRLNHALFIGHWFEPIETCLLRAESARVGLIQAGDLEFAAFTYLVTIALSIDCAPTLEAYLETLEAGLAFVRRTGSEHLALYVIAFRQHARCLRGETDAPDSFSDAEFDEAAYRAGLSAQDSRAGTYHSSRALAAAVFGDTAQLIDSAALAHALLPQMQPFYLSAHAQLLQALALAQRLQAAPAAQHAGLLAELDDCADWLARRAVDGPANFLHLSLLVQAERAWATGDDWSAARAFDDALREAASSRRPWHQALITERAALFHLAHGMEHSGRQGLAEAHRLYSAWGASAKASALQRHPKFRASAAVASLRTTVTAPSTVLQDNAIELIGILRASQAFSTETQPQRLVARVVELLGAMTGATAVRVLVRHGEPPAWWLTPQGEGSPLSLNDAQAQRLLPMTAFRYAERTLEPLLVDDATRDDRFSRDPYLVGTQHHSLLVVPILSQGQPRAMLVLENRLGAGAFAAERLDAVMLVAGQLAVSLDNTLLETDIARSEHDKTELQRHNAQLTELNAKLSAAQAQLLESEKLASIGQLAAGIAHEINNPIGFIFSNFGTLQGYLDDLFEMLDAYRAAEPSLGASAIAAGLAAMRERVELDYLKDDIPVLMRETKDGIARVRQIVQDMRDFSRVDQGQDWQWAALHQGLDSTLNVATNEIKYRADVVKEYGDIPDIQCLPSQLNQVFMNLAVNAAHAMGDSGAGPRGVITIRTGVEAEGAEEPSVWVEIADNGSGIAPEHLSRIFDPFFTTKPVGKGTGLGLSLSYGIVKKHGGRIEVRSRLGHGTTFRVVLPVTQPAATAAAG